MNGGRIISIVLNLDRLDLAYAKDMWSRLLEIHGGALTMKSKCGVRLKQSGPEMGQSIGALDMW